MTKIAIIGNGPSREIYKRLHSCYDVVIGCNYPDVPVQYSAMVDAHAAKYVRKKAMMHHRLKEFKLILGARCINSLGSFKDVPGGSQTLAEWLCSEGHVKDIVTYPEEFCGEGDSQKYFSSGHMAFFWATENYPNASIDMFGFDSLFTGDHGVTLSREILRDGLAKERSLQEANSTVTVWEENWELLLNEQYYNSVAFHGYEGDRTPHFRERRLAVRLWNSPG